MSQQYPILEFDPAATAIIEPGKLTAHQDVPECCVFCFFREVIDKLCADFNAKKVACETSEMGEHPLYEIRYQDTRLAVMHPGVGAPLAAALFEAVIAMGCKRFIVCGGAGVLDREIAVGHIIVPASAIRDEGTSYHYLPPSREVSATPEAVLTIMQTLDRHGYQYLVAKTWTTDAYYRETNIKTKRRREEGCLTVEMEAAALFAVAKFRSVSLGQMLYGGDDISGNEWDSRQWNSRTSIRERLFWLAAEACLSLS